MRRLLVALPLAHVFFACGPGAEPASKESADGGVAAADAGSSTPASDAGGSTTRKDVAGACGATLTSARYGAGPDGKIFTSDEAAHGVAFAPDGSLWVTGEYRGDADFGGGPRTAGDQNASLFVLKLDAQGQHVASKGFGDPSPGLIYAPGARGRAIATDASGGAVVAGSFAGRIDFGGGELVSAGEPNDAGVPSGGCATGTTDCAADALVVAFDANGAHRYSRRFGASGADVAYAIATDAAGNAYVAGSFEGTVSFGAESLTALGKSDIFVAKLDPSGDVVFAKRFGGVEDDAALAIAVDATGGIVIGGRYAGLAVFAQTGGSSIGLQANKGPYDGFVAKLDAQGNTVWATKLSSERGMVSGVAVAPDGHVVIAGQFRTEMNLGALGGQKGVYIEDAFVASLGADGAAAWAKVYGGTGQEQAAAIAVDDEGLLHVTGRNGSPSGMDFGGGAIGGGLYPGVFVATLKGDGTHVCSRSYAGAPKDASAIADGGIQSVGASGAAIAVAKDGRIAASGSFAATLDVGKGPMTSSGGGDAFIATFAPSP